VPGVKQANANIMGVARVDLASLIQGATAIEPGAHGLRALDSFMGHAQKFVTGEVRLRLEPGRCFVAGRRADQGLYSHDLATYDASDTFRHEDSAGFVRLWGLSVETWAREQGGPSVGGDA